MPRTREVGTLWIGGPLSWMEQVCLKSFVDKGQQITLFSYEDIPNVPDGVIRRDGREIIDTDDFIKYEQKDSYALFADLFRLHMIHQNPGMIWVDTDVYCHRPMDYDSDYVLGFELPGEHRVNNAVLGLPADSEMLHQMLDFTVGPLFDRAVPAEEAARRRCRKARDAGKPVHVSQQPWGVWGPLMVTHYVHALGLAEHVQPLNAFYPITFRDRTKFMRNADIAEALLTEETTALHLWASNKRQLGNHHDGLPPQGSYLDTLVRKHGITPALAPIKGRGKASFDGALIDELDLDAVASVADLTGDGAQFRAGAAAPVRLRYPSDRHRLAGGNWRRSRTGSRPTSAFLTDHEVDPDRIKVIRDAKRICARSTSCAISRVSATATKSPPLRTLPRALPAFGFAALHGCPQGFGRVSVPARPMAPISRFRRATEDGKGRDSRSWSRRNRPNRRMPPTNWDHIATELAGKDGFYRPGTAGHSFLYMPAQQGHAGCHLRQPRYRHDQARGPPPLGLFADQGAGLVDARRAGRWLDVVPRAVGF